MSHRRFAHAHTRSEDAGASRAPQGALDEEQMATRVMVISITIMGALLGLYTSMQSSLVFGVVSEALRDAPPSPPWELAIRATVNLLSVGALVALVLLLHPERRHGAIVWVQVGGIAVAVGAIRGGLQAFAGIYDLAVPHSRDALILEIGTTTLVGVTTMIAGLVQQQLWRRVMAADRVRFLAQSRANDLLRALQEEELRVRGEISQTLHGTVQGVFVVLEARLEAIAGRLRSADADDVRAVAADLSHLREGEIRRLSGALYPADLERGVHAALATVLARVPPSVSVTASFADAAARLDAADVEVTDRVLVIRIVEEALSNALRHGGAMAIALSITAQGRRVEITVDNDGAAPPAAAAWSGLSRLRQYLDLSDGHIELIPGGALGGARLQAALTV